MIHILYKV